MQEIIYESQEIKVWLEVSRKGQSWYALFSYYDGQGKLLRDNNGMGFPTEDEAQAFAKNYGEDLKTGDSVAEHLQMLADADADDRYRRRIAFGLAVLISVPCLFRCYHGFLSGHHVASLLWFLAAVVFALDYLGVVLSGGPGHLFEWGVVELSLSVLTSIIGWAFVLTAVHFSLQTMGIVEELWLDLRANRLAAGKTVGAADTGRE